MGCVSLHLPTVGPRPRGGSVESDTTLDVGRAAATLPLSLTQREAVRGHPESTYVSGAEGARCLPACLPALLYRAGVPGGQG